MVQDEDDPAPPPPKRTHLETAKASTQSLTTSEDSEHPLRGQETACQPPENESCEDPLQSSPNSVKEALVGHQGTCTVYLVPHSVRINLLNILS